MSEALSHLEFKRHDMLRADAIHVVPEVLRGQPSRVRRQPAGECRLSIPIGEGQLAAWADGAVNGCQQQILAAG